MTSDAGGEPRSAQFWVWASLLFLSLWFLLQHNTLCKDTQRCMHTRTHMHANIHVHTLTCTHTREHMAGLYAHTYTHTDIHTYAHTGIYTHAHTQQGCMHTHTHTHKHTRVDIHTRTYTHMHTHTRTHTTGLSLDCVVGAKAGVIGRELTRGVWGGRVGRS